MFSVRDLRTWARTLGPEEFQRQVGPFVLIQRPPDPLLQALVMTMGAQRTWESAKKDRTVKERVVEEVLLMVRELDDLVVCTLPPLEDSAEIAVGRLPDCDLVVDDPSVSKHHALLRWNALQGGCSVQDLGSMNGTLVNARALERDEEQLLADGAVLAFGDPEFLYFLTDPLYRLLAGAGIARG